MTHPERPGVNLVSPPRFELGPPGSRPATLPDYAMESLILNFSTSLISYRLFLVRVARIKLALPRSEGGMISFHYTLKFIV